MNLSGDWEKLAKKLENLATDTPQKVEMTLKQVAEQAIKEVKEEYGHRVVYYGKKTNKVVPGVFMLKKTIDKLEPVFRNSIGSTIKAEFDK